MGGRDHPNIHGDGAVAPHGIDHALLQHAQQFDLHVQRQVTDFIQKEGAAMGQLKSTNSVGHRPGESPLAMSKQFAFQQILGNGGTVDGHEMGRGALRLIVQGACDQFLARATLTCDQHGRRRVGHPSNELADGLGGFAVSYEGVR